MSADDAVDAARQACRAAVGRMAIYAAPDRLDLHRALPHLLDPLDLDEARARRYARPSRFHGSTSCRRWKGWQSLGLSPDTIFTTSNVRDEFVNKFVNSVICSSAPPPSQLSSARWPPTGSAVSTTSSARGETRTSPSSSSRSSSFRPSSSRCRFSFSTRGWRCSTRGSASSSSTH